MEAMFAGVEGDENKRPPDGDKPPPKKRGRKPKSERIGEEDKKPDGEVKQKRTYKKRKGKDSLPNGKEKPGKKRSKDDQEQSSSQEKLLEKYRGPFIRVKGKLTSPHFVNVINSASDALDDKDKKKGMSDFDQRLRVISFGPSCNSTLSSKYDPKVIDESWKCVFCHKGSHTEGLGDLYGPYFVSQEVIKRGLNDVSPVKSRQEIAASFVLGSNPKKRKRGKFPELPSKDPNSATHGKVGNDEAEVWCHEDCLCWNPEIRLVGSHIFGIEDAIGRTQKAPCSLCHLPGSTICCIRPGCRDVAHFLCANSNNWRLNEDLFQAYCHKHVSSS